jgi:signal transduction histidine kinase
LRPEIHTPEVQLSPDAEKMVSAFVVRYRHSRLGSLVNGITHNVNGVLQILAMQVELLQIMLAREGRGRADASPALLKCEACQEQIDKLTGLIRVLTERANHEEEEEARPIDLNDLLEEELALLKNNLFFKHHVTLTKRLSSPLPPVHGGYRDFSQAVSNLIQNSLEAMEQTERKELTLSTACRNGFVRLAVADSGCGIPEEARSRLFEPFFTMKRGPHLGLGLFVAKRVLAPCRASFAFVSRRGRTAFTVDLPLCGTRAAAERRSSPEP